MTGDYSITLRLMIKYHHLLYLSDTYSPMDKLNLLRLFLQTVDKGSFAATASSLGLSPSTVSKAISRLETDLQFFLFYRTTRQLTLTDAGRTYALTVKSLVSDLERCEQDLGLANSNPKGRLKINLPTSYGRCYVLPLISEFNRLYPDIQFDLSFDDAYVDMIERGIDISIRSGTMDDSSLIARQLSPMDFITCASPAYLKQHPKIKVQDFAKHPWVRFKFRQTGRLMPILADLNDESLLLDPGQDFIVDDGEAMATLCAQGLGITQFPHFIARDWIRRGDLISIVAPFRHPDFAVWAIYAKRDFLPEKIRVFVDFLQQQLKKRGESTYQTWAEEPIFSTPS